MIRILQTPDPDHDGAPREIADTCGVGGWEFTIDSYYPGFSAKGSGYEAFQVIRDGFTPELNDDGVDTTPSRLVYNRSGFIVPGPCNEEDDEKFLLVAVCGGFRGHFSKMEEIGVKVLEKWVNNRHDTPTMHLSVLVENTETGFVACESGRESGEGLVQIFSWKNGYAAISTEEYETWKESFPAWAIRVWSE